jgi:hypothetical protein
MHLNISHSEAEGACSRNGGEEEPVEITGRKAKGK